MCVDEHDGFECEGDAVVPAALKCASFCAWEPHRVCVCVRIR